MISARVKVRGGKRLRARLRMAGRGGVGGVDVGFFKDAQYQTGEYVAYVASIHEFGLGHHRERPFFRAGVKNAEEPIRRLLIRHCDTKRMTVSRGLAKLVGRAAVGKIAEQVVFYKVIDTGLLHQSVHSQLSSEPMEKDR